ncbi:SLH family protein [Deinococcus seoulensis]|uniref:SLH family protein n=1 Tax=Deinococcus seoulensis TaxID=1837379 RepID=A0ABQ2RRN0_9DEIO|nr:S-layer homology domain-containing protein [Deinococcus seoulensis]GGR60819.1 SLH family protein [Deinococcus seoulensis]
MRTTLLLAALALGAASAQTTPAVTLVPTPAASVTITDVPAGHWAREAIGVLMGRGLLQGFPDGSFSGQAPLTRYEAATLLYRLLTSGTLSQVQLTPADMQAIARGLEEVTAEILTLSARLNVAEAKNRDQDARLSTIEGQAPLVGARLDAVEAAVLATAPLLDGTVPRGEYLALQARVAALETERAANVPAPAPTVAQAQVSAPAAPVTPAVTTPAFPPAQKAPGEPQQNASQPRNLYLGLTATTPVSSEVRVGGEATLGMKNAVAGFGVQVSAGYRPSAKAFTAEAALTRPFAFQGVTPYAGVGAGAAFSPRRGAITENATDSYLSGLVGVDYPFNESVAFTGELGVRYFLSNHGYASGLDAGVERGVSPGARLGVKFRF